MKTAIKKIVIFSSIGIISSLIMLGNDAEAKTQDKKTETFKQDGMTFVVGKHEPDKRENPAQNNEKIIEKVIVKEKVIERVQNNQFLEENEEGVVINEENTEEAQEDANLLEGELEEKNIFARWSAGIWNVTKDVVLGAAAIFENTVDFLGRVTFMDRVTFADKDMAGEAIVEKGEEEVKIEFENPFIFPPMITITPQEFFGKFSLKNVTEEGFSIVIEEKAKSEVVFKWMALSIAEPKTKDNKDEKSVE